MLQKKIWGEGLGSLFALALVLGLFTPAKALAIDVQEFEKKLTSAEGVEGEVHGAAVPLSIYVFNYRNPTNFFDYLEMSLVSFDAEITRKLATLSRHDRVRIKGQFLLNPSPQKHITLSSLEVVKKYQSGYAVDPYHYEAKIPDEILHEDCVTFLVHAVHADGHVLVVEYKDAVMPIYVRNGELTKNLSRNDIVRLRYKIQQTPDRPAHLMLDETKGDAVRVVDSIVGLHGKPADFEGALVLFPQSPEVKFNVFAVLQELPHGLRRQFTLVNFDSPEAFAAIRLKLQQAWDRHPGKWVNGRNKLVNTVVRVRAKGSYNEVDPNQANAQILLKDVNAIEVIER